MIVIHSMMTYAKTASRWSRRTAPIAASTRRKMDADFGDMPGAGWSNGSSPGFNGSAASLSAGSSIRRTSLASCNSLASSSSSNDFEIGSNQKRRSLPLALSIAVTLAATAALAASENFDEVKPGEIPDGWTCGVTGKGSPIWKVEADASAPSSPNVLKQSGSGTFPWCVRQSVRIADGFVEVKFKPLAGRADQAGGVVWRFKDGDEYYIARG